MKRTVKFSGPKNKSLGAARLALFSVLALLIFSGCREDEKPQLGYLNLLSTKEDFLEMSYKTSSVNEQYGWQTIKVYYEKNKDEIYFMDTKRFKAHDDFMKNVLKLSSYPEEDYFLEEDERYLYRATLNMLTYKDKDILLMQIDAGDTLSGKALKVFFNKIREKVTFEAGLYFNPVSYLQEVKVQQVESLPVLTNNEVLSNVESIVYSDYVSYGYLRKWSEEKCFDRTDIVVFKEVPPNDIVTGGVITERPQTRLSHLSLMSEKNQVLNIYYEGASARLAKYFDKPVKVEVLENGRLNIKEIEDEPELVIKDFLLSKSTKENRMLLLEEKTSEDEPIINNVDMSLERPLSMDEYNKLVSEVGSKSANLTLVKGFYPQSLYESFNINFPGTISLSFRAYDEFMDQKNVEGITLRNQIRKILGKDKNLRQNSTCRAVKSLKEVREIIKNASVPEKHLLKLKKYIIQDKTSPVHQDKQIRLRLRSSSNFEDNSHSMGAGLFESKGVWLYEKKNKEDKGKYASRTKSRPRSWDKIKKSLSLKIPKVYASVFSDKVYAQVVRDGLSVDDLLKVKMGVLIHRAFPRYDFDQEDGELANGVAITKNIFNDEPDDRSIYINAQHRDISVTNPPSLKKVRELYPEASSIYRTEEILIPWEPDNDNYVGLEEEYKYLDYNYLSRSSLSNKNVFNDDPRNHAEPKQMELRMLGHMLKLYSSKIESFFNDKTKAFEFEFKIYGEEREIWIKQARPYLL